MNLEQAKQIDDEHIWHPYSAIGSGLPIFHVDSANGCKIKLKDGRELIDGMSSWWSVIHGYNNPQLNQAIIDQSKKMSHVMFGGLTHDPAIELAKKLVELTPDPLQTVFFADSGSVAVEVAIKMAIQYWSSCGKPEKQGFVTVKNGYHGDTFGAMSVCDPENGMHGLFSKVLPTHLFAEAPQCGFQDKYEEHHLNDIRSIIEEKHEQLAAIIIEPIVQGAGGMRFYSPEYLAALRALANEFNLLLICDEIATGFGRTGKLFACEHADISPDILCLGKALTGGYMTLAATLTTQKVSQQISAGSPGVFMHGPTFMANPLACAVANKSIELLTRSNWQEKLIKIEERLLNGLSACSQTKGVSDVRVLGAIGVVELSDPVDMKRIQPMFVEAGIWVRPFGKLVYVMPPFIISEEELETLCSSLVSVVKHYLQG